MHVFGEKKMYKLEL